MPATLYDALDSDAKIPRRGCGMACWLWATCAGHGATFCFAGKQFDERLQGLGAQRLGEIGCLDASDGTLPEDRRRGLGPTMARPGRPGLHHLG
jgi:hypothetical protein